MPQIQDALCALALTAGNWRNRLEFAAVAGRYTPAPLESASATWVRGFGIARAKRRNPVAASERRGVIGANGLRFL